MRRTLLTAAVLTLAAFVQPVQGQSADYPSFMNATCYSLDCSVVQFNLETTPVSFVEYLTWTLEGSAVESGITFDGNVVAESGLWAPTYFGGGQIKISAGGAPVETPAWFRLGLVGVGSAEELTTGEAVRYNGFAWEDETYSDQVSFGGYVVPEPEGWAMILTGLLLIGVVGWRRSAAGPESSRGSAAGR